MEAKEIKEVEEEEEVKERRRGGWRAEYDESERVLWRRSRTILAHRYLTCRAKVFQWLKGRVKRQKFEPGLRSPKQLGVGAGAVYGGDGTLKTGTWGTRW